MSADGQLLPVPRAAATPAPPHNLGAKLKPHHFYDPVHGRIFEVCGSMIAAGRLADGVTLREHFIRENALREIGGATYLITLMENAARMPVHAQEYAEI